MATLVKPKSNFSAKTRKKGMLLGRKSKMGQNKHFDFLDKTLGRKLFVAKAFVRILQSEKASKEMMTSIDVVECTVMISAGLDFLTSSRA